MGSKYLWPRYLRNKENAAKGEKRSQNGFLSASQSYNINLVFKKTKLVLNSLTVYYFIID
jgi:hypothetical protein